jgi:hypothetical protein
MSSRLDARRFPPKEPGHHADVRGDRHVGEEADLLEDVADPPAELERIPLAGVAPPDRHMPAVRDDEAVDQLEERALARAAASDKRERLARRDIQIQTAQHGPRRAPRDVDVAHRDGETSLQLPASSFQPCVAYRASMSD